MDPYEIIAAPFEVYAAVLGTAFPAVNAAPAVDWKLIGSNGSKNHTEEGVSVAHSQEQNLIKVAGLTAPIKAFRTAEGLVISLTLYDLTLEQYRRAMNDATVTDTGAGAGTAGYREFNIYRGITVADFALLIRGNVSPYDPALKCQWQIPRVIESGSPTIALSKMQPAGVALQFTALADPDQASDGLRFGKFIAQDAAPA